MLAFLFYIALFFAIYKLFLKIAHSKKSSNKKTIASSAVFFVTLFLIFWLIPMSVQGFFKWSYPGLPKTFVDWHRASCLFTGKMRSWAYFYVQMWSDTKRDWVTLNERSYFKMEPFGYRTRFDRFVSRYRRPEDKKRVIEIFNWLRDQYMKANPDVAVPRAMRLVYHSVEFGEWEWKKRWEKPSLSAFPPERMNVALFHKFEVDEPLPVIKEPKEEEKQKNE